MITLFAMPKSFDIPHIRVIQRNAIRSWIKLSSECEIILLGDDHGTADIAKEFGLRHILKVERNEFGTPVISSLFNLAQEASATNILAYINSDIILMKDFPAAVRQVPSDFPFLLIGRRWDLDVTELIDFEVDDWEDKLRRRLTSDGNQDQVFGGSDYFVFRKGMWGEIPPIALGRYIFDNWLIHRALEIGAKVVDTTPVVTAVHQKHEYNHHPLGTDGVIYGVETWRDLHLAGGPSIIRTLFDANFVLTHEGLRSVEVTEELLERKKTMRRNDTAWLSELERRHLGDGESGVHLLDPDLL